MKKSTLTIDPSIFPIAFAIKRTERILSGKIKLPLDQIVWTYNEVKRLLPERDDLLKNLQKHIEIAKKVAGSFCG